MDMSKIFLKDACPTSIGGQALLEGIMMRGPERTAMACRLPDGRIYLKTTKNKASSKWMKMPIIRGVVSFVSSLAIGTGMLTKSADVQEYFMEDEDESYEPGKFEAWLTEKLGSQKIWNLMIAVTVLIALVFSIGIFVLLPTAVIDLLKPLTENAILLNLIEGILRIVMFIAYIVIIARMEDIKRVFEYHGAEHKTIHCFENNLELTPANAQQFYTLHPRCGTSFLMFVMVISLILFSLLGWPTLAFRILSRLLLIPVVAGLSYELLKWAGRSDNIIVRTLSIPGLLLQKLTTNEPNDEELEVAIVSMKAVLVPADAPLVEGICDLDANILEPMDLDKLRKEREEQEAAGKGSTAQQEPAAEEVDEPEETADAEPAEKAGEAAV